MVSTTAFFRCPVWLETWGRKEDSSVCSVGKLFIVFINITGESLVYHLGPFELDIP